MPRAIAASGRALPGGTARRSWKSGPPGSRNAPSGVTARGRSPWRSNGPAVAGAEPGPWPERRLERAAGAEQLDPVRLDPQPGEAAARQRQQPAPGVVRRVPAAARAPVRPAGARAAGRRRGSRGRSSRRRSRWPSPTSGRDARPPSPRRARRRQVVPSPTSAYPAGSGRSRSGTNEARDRRGTRLAPPRGRRPAPAGDVAARAGARAARRRPRPRATRSPPARRAGPRAGGSARPVPTANGSSRNGSTATDPSAIGAAASTRPIRSRVAGSPSRGASLPPPMSG